MGASEQQLATRLKSFSNDGLSFPVEDSGPLSGEIVVLLHGFPQTGRAWKKVAESLNMSGFRTVVPDLRGYSATARPKGRANYRSSKIVGDVLALISALQIDSANLIGHDWGALLAWSVAAAYPKKVRSLVAVSVPHYAAYLLSMVTSNQLVKSYYIVLFQFPLVAEGLFRLFPRSFEHRLADSGMAKESIERVKTDVVKAGALTAGINWYRGLLVSNQRAMTRRVLVPTVFVWGDRDTLLGRAGAQLTARFVAPPYRLKIVEGGSHWLPEESPEEIVDAFVTLHNRLRSTR